MDVLKIRAALLRSVREFFADYGYLEVETPCMARDVVLDAWISPWQVMGHSGDPPWFLQTSPEAFMKRLLAAGSGSIFQVARVFRQEEFGQRHNPEFTMVEWYGVGDTWEDQTTFTERLVRHCLKSVIGLPACNTAAWPEQPFPRVTYENAFLRAFGVNVHTATDTDLRHAAEQAQVIFPEGGPPLERDDLLNLMLGWVIEPQLGGRSGSEAPEFLCDYPPSQAALAVLSDSAPAVARRFELYVRGLELCNGYQELTDSDELLRREHRQREIRSSQPSAHPLPGAPGLAAAMKAGLPSCSGVALGFDRLVMLATGAETIQQVLPFPADRA